jgi:hypothetical protein
MTSGGRAWVSQYEHRHVIHRVLAPPARAPALIGPGPANRPEHVPAENPGSDVLKAPGGKVFVDAVLPAVVAEHVPLKRPRGHGPAMQRGATHAERVVEVLVPARAEAVQGDGETFDAEFGHGFPKGVNDRERWP